MNSQTHSLAMPSHFLSDKAVILTKMALMGSLLLLGGCAVHPLPPPPPPDYVEVPAPNVYYATPCCSAYYVYPPYYYGTPRLNFFFGSKGGRHDRGHHGRGGYRDRGPYRHHR